MFCRSPYAYLSVTAGYLVAQGGSSLVDIHPNVANIASDHWVRSMSQAAYVRIAIQGRIEFFRASPES
jgi:hypothetical protein